MSRILVGMSGGVDSAAAAALLIDGGYEVEGSFCVMSDAVERSLPDAQKTAAELGVPLHIIDLRKAFERILDDFCSEYAAGRTPNPCVLCNPEVKFKSLCELAERLDIPAVATGHYARIGKYGGRDAIFKGLSPKNDQSYMLYRLTPEILGMLRFPLGEFDKAAARSIAGAKCLSSAEKRASSDLCFTDGENYADIVASRLGRVFPPGPIFGPGGERLGTHRGILSCTVGQRRGLGVAAAERLFVCSIDAGANAVHVDTGSSRCAGIRLSRFVSHIPLGGELAVTVKTRHGGREAAATLVINGGGAEIYYKEPAPLPAPGQSAVCYIGELVAGGGIIESAI